MRLLGDRPEQSRHWLTGLMVAVLALAGCSANDTLEQPAPVPDVVSSVELKRIWKTGVGDGHDEQLLYLAPLYTGANIYAASAGGELLALKAENGKRLWRRDLDERIMAGVGGDASQLYLVTRDAKLKAFDREDGSPLWEATLPNEVLASPASNGSLVVAQTIDGKVLAFGAASGDKLWQFDSTVPALTLRAAAAPLVGRDFVLASLANGKLMALAGDNGQPLWQYEVGTPQGRTELERLVDITAQPLILDSSALVVGYQGKLALVDLRNGRELWSREASSLYSPMVGEGNIYLSLANGTIVAYDGTDRRELWSQDKLSWRQTTQPVVYDGHLLVGDYQGYIHMLSLEDGSLQGQMQFDDDGLRVPFQRLQDGRLLVYGNSGDMAVFELRKRD